MEQILQQLTVTQKKHIIKSNDKLNELFKNKTHLALSKAKGEDIDNFINDLNKEERKIITELGSSELGIEDIKAKGKQNSPKGAPVSEYRNDVPSRKNSKKDQSGDSEANPDNGKKKFTENIPGNTVNEITNVKNVKKEMAPAKTPDLEVHPSLTADGEHVLAEEKEIPEEVLKKIFKDLYPTNIHKTKYIQENPSLKMAALTRGIFGKNAKKEDIDDFLVKQVPKNPKSMKQLSVDWLESKKTMKIDPNKLTDDSINVKAIRNALTDVSLEDFEAYAYLMQAEISDKIFAHLEEIKAEDLKKSKESGAHDSEKVKSLENKIKELENRHAEAEERQRDEINSFKQNYESEKEKARAKNEQRLETLKNKYEEEKLQLIKIQADSDRRFSEERKIFNEQLELTEKENKKLLDRINNIGSDLMNQNKQHKDTSKSLTRTQNMIDELQADNKELVSKNEELKSSYALVSSQIAKYRKQEAALQTKVQQLSIQIQELEKTKVAFLLNESELQSVIRELNAVDESKERMLQLLNIDTRQVKDQDEQVQSLDDLWVTLIGQEEDIIADYLSVGTQEVATKDFLKEKIDSLLDLEYNLKAREVLVKMLYEKGYKAYKNLQ